jgi:carboxypeptidase C (cathepsin A)
VGTGFSRATTPDEGRKFYDTHGDIVSVGEFIRIYCTRFDRWESPKFIAGESYGTTRAAGLANFLAQREGINLNGVILISSVLSFQAIQPSVSNETPFALYLPSYTAVALYHKRLAADLEADQQKTIRAAEDFAVNAYLPALTMGNNLDGTQRNAIAEQLSRFTGLSKQVILDNDLRVSPERFEKSLLADQHEVIGRFDGRMTAPIADNASEAPPFDPSLGPYLGEYTATFNQYIRHDLHFKSDLNYEVLSNKVHPWNFGDHGEGYLYTGDDLADAMTQNPHLKLLVCAAWQDLATPFFAADYVVDHLPIPPERKANITQAYFPGGHMLYHDAPNLVKLHDTISKFITDAVAP